MKKSFFRDRKEFLDQIVNEVSKVKEGCIYFLTMAKFSTDRIPKVGFSNLHVLRVFEEVLLSTNELKVIENILMALKILVVHQGSQLIKEWDKVIDIISFYFFFSFQ